MSEKEFAPGVITDIKGFWLVTNYSCNNRCSWCYAQTMGFKPKEMPLAYAEDVLELMASFGCQKGILIGGEPTVHGHFLEILQAFKARDIYPAIVSNGRRYSDLAFLEEARGIASFGTTISMQSNKEDVHDAITEKPGSFAETLQGLRNCVSLSIPTSVQVTITPHNLPDIYDFIKLVEDTGAKDFVIGFGLPPFEENPTMEGLINIQEIPKIITDIFTKTKSWDIQVAFNQFIPLCMYGEVLDEMLAAKAIRTGCHMSYGNMVVWEPTGEISPCAHFSGKYIVEGLMSETEGLIPRTKRKFLQVWNQPYLVEFRKQRFSYISPHCRDCQYWGLCTGGCPINWFYYDPTVLVDHIFEGR